jgi:hypothetical protein
LVSPASHRAPEDLRWIFPDLAEVELRPMAEQPPDSPLFGAADRNGRT